MSGGVRGQNVPRAVVSFDLAVTAAHHCKEILTEHKFGDVEIAFRESTVTRSVGPRLLHHFSIINPAVDLRSPFTPAFGIQIAPLDTPHYEGTGGLYFRESSDSDRVLLLTNRHVALPPPVFDNALYHRKHSNQPAHEMIVLGSKAYADAVEAIMAKIGEQVGFAKTYKEELERLGEDADDETGNDFQQSLAKAKKTIADLDALHSEITKSWIPPSLRKLGYVLYAPPISVAPDPELYTEDWAMLNLHLDKF
ncbi:hypothetical protein M407DRAFT_29309, partial [Tulasnella calospora MUT 4182]